MTQSTHDRFASLRRPGERPVVKDDIALFSALRGPRFVGDDPDRFDLQYHCVDSRNDFVVAYAILGPGCQGPPGHCHGGAIATLLDEAMGFACWFGGHPVVAARLSVGFRRPLPLQMPVRIEGWFERVSGTKITTRSRVCTTEDDVYSDADGLFVVLGHDRFKAMADLAKK